MENILNQLIKGTYLLSRIISGSIRLWRDTDEFYKLIVNVSLEASGGINEVDDDEL